jgi:hypothetical protein
LVRCTEKNLATLLQLCTAFTTAEFEALASTYQQPRKKVTLALMCTFNVPCGLCKLYSIFSSA